MSSFRYRRRRVSWVGFRWPRTRRWTWRWRWSSAAAPPAPTSTACSASRMRTSIAGTRSRSTAATSRRTVAGRRVRAEARELPRASPSLAKTRAEPLFLTRRSSEPSLARLVGVRAFDKLGPSWLGSARVHPDIGRVVFTTGLNLLSRIGFSRDLADLDDLDECKDFQGVCAEIMEVAGMPNVSDFFPALAAVDLQGARRRMARLFARLHRVIDAEVDRRLRSREVGSEPRKNDFLDVLLDDDKTGLERDTIRALFTDLYAAGMNNITNTMEWAMVELLQNPSSMAKACDELSRVIGSGRNIEEAETGQLPYLQAVIKETLRLHPPAPLLLPRQADAATEIAGYTIPKGARVLVNVWAMGHNEDIWPETEKFMPERFLGRTVDFRGGDFELIPFGAGRRICPGMPLAIKMVHVILGSLLNQFKWRLPIEVERNGIDMTEKFGVNVTKAVPVCAIATPI